MPAIVDHEIPMSLFESGAILEYLAEKTGRFVPDDLCGRYEVMQWLYWQVGGLGPMAGQLSHFVNYAPKTYPYALERYRCEYDRLLGVMDRRLADAQYVAGGNRLSGGRVGQRVGRAVGGGRQHGDAPGLAGQKPGPDDGRVLAGV